MQFILSFKLGWTLMQFILSFKLGWTLLCSLYSQNAEFKILISMVVNFVKSTDLNQLKNFSFCVDILC